MARSKPAVRQAPVRTSPDTSADINLRRECFSIVTQTQGPRAIPERIEDADRLFHFLKSGKHFQQTHAVSVQEVKDKVEFPDTTLTVSPYAKHFVDAHTL